MSFVIYPLCHAPSYPLCSGLSSTPRSTTFPSSSTCTQVVQGFSSPKLLVRTPGHRFLVPSLTISLPAGKDATDAFFGLHRHEVLLRPQYARLQIGTIAGQKEFIKATVAGELSGVPYAEPAWLSPGFHSPYYNDNHRRFQKEVRKFFEEVVLPDALKCEENGKRISQEVVDKLWCVRTFRQMCMARLCHFVARTTSLRCALVPASTSKDVNLWVALLPRKSSTISTKCASIYAYLFSIAFD